MNYQRLPGPRPGVLQRVVAALATTVILVALFFAGLVAWVLVAGVVLVGGAALSIWVWRQRRQFEKMRAAALRDADLRAPPRNHEPGRQTIEGEYVVVDERRER